ncbi:hypothetical protein HYR99_32750 [Candidatus Poribacteria bacterium]|nr:hypothetical protein [Candidatus Poribacteria bacterium]
MPLQWHPFLAQFLRQDYGDRLIIQEEVNLGDMPLRADLLLIRRDTSIELPYPFNFLGQQTLLEYKGPDTIANQSDLVQLEIYGLLYQQKESFWDRRELTLWLLASRFAENICQSNGAFLSDEQLAAPSVRHGSLDGFPTCFIDLERLPISEATLPLVMVSKGAQEEKLAEFLIDHHQTYADYLIQFIHLHPRTLREVLRMRQMTWEEIGVDPQDVIELFGADRTIENLVQLLGEDRATAHFARLIGKDRLKEILEQLPDESVEDKNSRA